MSIEIYRHSRRDIKTGRYIKRRILPVLVKCRCGCDSDILSQDKRGRWRYYLDGHGHRGDGRVLTKRGYMKIRAKEHPKSDRGYYVYEHDYVMEKHIGRLLMDGEVVHHINGIKTDNRIENLELLESQSVHINLHRKDLRRQN